MNSTFKYFKIYASNDTKEWYYHIEKKFSILLIIHHFLDILDLK